MLRASLWLPCCCSFGVVSRRSTTLLLPARAHEVVERPTRGPGMTTRRTNGAVRCAHNAGAAARRWCARRDARGPAGAVRCSAGWSHGRPARATVGRTARSGRRGAAHRAVALTRSTVRRTARSGGTAMRPRCLCAPSPPTARRTARGRTPDRYARRGGQRVKLQRARNCTRWPTLDYSTRPSPPCTVLRAVVPVLHKPFVIGQYTGFEGSALTVRGTARGEWGGQGGAVGWSGGWSQCEGKVRGSARIPAGTGGVGRFPAVWRAGGHAGTRATGGQGSTGGQGYPLFRDVTARYRYPSADTLYSVYRASTFMHETSTQACRRCRRSVTHETV